MAGCRCLFLPYSWDLSLFDFLILSFLPSIRIPGICTETRHRGDQTGRRYYFCHGVLSRIHFFSSVFSVLFGHGFWWESWDLSDSIPFCTGVFDLCGWGCLLYTSDAADEMD